MSFGYRSRGSRSNFRSPRGSSSRGSFRGRGRGSDSHFRSSRGSRSSRDSRGSSFRSRSSRSSSYRGGSFKGSSFHDRDDFYEGRSGGSKYSHDRYGSSHRRDEDSYHHRESSGSFGREQSRRSDFEPERKRMKSEISHYKEGASPRRGYDDIEHSSRGYNSSPSSYHGDSSPFKSHKKDYGEFKKPLPVEREFRSRRPSRAIRSRGSRGGISRTFSTKHIKPLMSSSIKRIAIGRINKISSATRLQLLLRRKKQLRIMRLRRAREERERTRSESKREEANDITLSEEEEDDVAAAEELDDSVESKESKTSAESRKVVPKEIKKEPKSEPEETTTNEVAKPKAESSSARGLQKSRHITLKCIHCKTEFRTFKVYLRHLQNYKHKKAMDILLHRLKQKLNKMRNEQREQQRLLDEQCEDFARTSYCKLCKLNYKQTRQEHYTSDFHVTLSEFLNPKCTVCCMKFQTPILFEHHRCTLAHIKRKASQTPEMKGEQEMDEDNNDEESFMVLDSVGSADESNDENEDDAGKTEDKEGSKTKKKDKIVGEEFIKKVACYYCKLCAMCLRYSPKVNQDELLLRHCRTRFHLKRYSLDQSSKQKISEKPKETENESTEANNSEVVEPEEQEEKLWTDENGDEDHKLSEDEEDSKSNSRYDRFGHSDEKENLDKQKTSSETESMETIKTEKID